MKWLMFVTCGVLLGAASTHMALAEVTYIESDGKRYTVVEIDDEMLVSNEWGPVDESGYTIEIGDRIKAIKESIK